MLNNLGTFLKGNNLFFFTGKPHLDAFLEDTKQQRIQEPQADLGGSMRSCFALGLPLGVHLLEGCDFTDLLLNFHMGEGFVEEVPALLTRGDLFQQLLHLLEAGLDSRIQAVHS